MYRIFAQSYENYKNQVSDARLRLSEPIELLCDHDRFIIEKRQQDQQGNKRTKTEVHVDNVYYYPFSGEDEDLPF